MAKRIIIKEDRLYKLICESIINEIDSDVLSKLKQDYDDNKRMELEREAERLSREHGGAVILNRPSLNIDGPKVVGKIDIDNGSKKYNSFIVKKELNPPYRTEEDILKNLSYHAGKDKKNKNRLKNIKEILGGFGYPVASFLVNEGRTNDQIHTIFSNGIIAIQNKDTNQVVTVYVAGPSHIIRYYKYIWENSTNGKKEKFDESNLPSNIIPVINKTKENEAKGYTRWDNNSK